MNLKQKEILFLVKKEMKELKWKEWNALQRIYKCNLKWERPVPILEMEPLKVNVLNCSFQF